MFDDVRLPEDIEQGARGGPGFKTTVIQLSSGFEQRNIDWARSRGRWDISYGVETKEDYSDVLEFFFARQGRARGFRFKDWSDFQAVGQLLGTGDGVQTDFALRKRYTSLVTYDRRITRPVANTLQVYVDGTPVPPADYNLLPLGIVSFKPSAIPLLGQAVTADFEFDVPVRFDVDTLPIEVIWEQVGSIPEIAVVEVRE